MKLKQQFLTVFFILSILLVLNFSVSVQAIHENPPEVEQKPHLVQIRVFSPPTGITPSDWIHWQVTFFSFADEAEAQDFLDNDLVLVLLRDGKEVDFTASEVYTDPNLGPAFDLDHLSHPLSVGEHLFESTFFFSGGCESGCGPFQVPVTVISPAPTTRIPTTKVLEVREQNVNFTSNPGTFTICGTTDTFTDNFHVGQSSFVLWNNGHSLVTFNAEGKLFDSAGNVIARQVIQNKQVTGEGSLPLSIQFNQVITCTGNSGTPGKLVNFHFGITIGEDGMLKQIHFVFNL